MERATSLEDAQKIMGRNFIGPKELKSIEERMGIYIPDEILETPPVIQFKKELLIEKKDEYILILGIPYYKDKSPLTIVKMRDHFGWDPNISEPCFYNQDWYLNEYFAKNKTFDKNWYLIKKKVFDKFRGKLLNEILPKADIVLPNAVIAIYIFFCNYLLNYDALWENDYLWCADIESSGDEIYIGKYIKPTGQNKNGFEIHRHLKIKCNYSFIDCK